jgi:hypothetical protein
VDAQNLNSSKKIFDHRELLLSLPRRRVYKERSGHMMIWRIGQNSKIVNLLGCGPIDTWQASLMSHLHTSEESRECECDESRFALDVCIQTCFKNIFRNTMAWFLKAFLYQITISVTLKAKRDLNKHVYHLLTTIFEKFLDRTHPRSNFNFIT